MQLGPTFISFSFLDFADFNQRHVALIAAINCPKKMFVAWHVMSETFGCELMKACGVMWGSPVNLVDWRSTLNY